MARKGKKTYAKSNRKTYRNPVMYAFICLCVVGVFIWYLVKRFGKSATGSTAGALSASSLSVEGGGTSPVPQGPTAIAGVHGINNPGNITYNPLNDWYGQVGYNERTINGAIYKYCNFETLYSGIRALYICINNVFERVNGINLSDGIGTQDYLTFVSSLKGKLGKFYETYAGQSGLAANFESIFAQMANSVDKPLTALAMAVYKMEAGANYDRAVMNEVKGFQYERVF